MNRRSGFAIVCLAGLVLGCLQNGAMVICFGADGQVEFEGVGHNHCGHEGGHNRAAGDAVTEDCRPCVDVEIQWTAEVKASERNRAGHIVAVMAALGGQIENSRPVDAYPAQCEWYGGFEEAMRSVVLVI